jgi:hypothetical protein
MDKQLARIIVSSGFRRSRELTDLLHLMKAKCTADEFERLKPALTNAIAEITVATFRPAFAAHPDLEAEVDATIREYGRFA